MRVFLIISVLLRGFNAFALQDCTRDLQEDEECKTDVLNLHPTQFTVGEIEVKIRAKKIARMDEDELKKYLKKKQIPVVIGPGGVLYLVDHHHFSVALFQSGTENRRVYVEVKKNWSSLSESEFWERMKTESFVYLYKRGKGPLPAESLPKLITEMTDDPYRSLAYFVREAGGYEKTSIFYAEYKWADFFRTRIQLGPDATESDLMKFIESASELAHSEEASGLPGFIRAKSNCRKKLLPD